MKIKKLKIKRKITDISINFAKKYKKVEQYAKF